MIINREMMSNLTYNQNIVIKVINNDEHITKINIATNQEITMVIYSFMTIMKKPLKNLERIF